MDEIALDSKGDISKIMAPGQERTQSLKGFDDDYVDIVDYIIRSTHTTDTTSLSGPAMA